MEKIYSSSASIHELVRDNSGCR